MIQFKEGNYPYTVSSSVMNEVYEDLRTPIKIGAVCKFDEVFTDSPSVYYSGNKWYMMYLTISKKCAASGYSTWVSESEDLIHWSSPREVLRRNDLNHWDSKQIAGYLGLADIEWDGSNIPRKINGEYMVSYLGGNADGYEPAPLYMGLSFTKDITNPDDYRRISKPILSPYDEDSRDGEKRMLFRSFIFEDTVGITDFKYVMVYNAKDPEYIERIFLAVSDDAVTWQRYGDRAILDGTLENSNNKIVADAQILRKGNLYIMVYFVLNYGEKAYSTFACSYDLVHWTQWNGEPLIKPELDWENEHAHKSWIVRHNGVTYNYYCAVNSNNERFIALAVSENLDAT